MNPSKEIINVYNFENEEASDFYTFDDNIPVGIYPNLSIKVGDLLK